jgi:RNA polymerase sigma-70 factor (ECF subfamily)
MNSSIILTHLYLHYFSELRTFLRRRVGCREIATELTQETFIRIMSYPDETIQNARAMLYRIAGNLVVDYYRAHMKHPEKVCIDDLPLHELPTTDLTDPARVVCARQILEKLCIAVEELPPQCHRAFVMHKFDGYSHVEIAQKLGVTRNAVEKLLIRALVQLRQVLV